MAGKEERSLARDDGAIDLAPVLARLTALTKLYQTQLAGLEELQRTLDENIASMLHRLEQRPVVDVVAITSRLDQAIDAVDRVMQRRIPRLMARRWWVPWLWLLAGIVLGSSGYWWATQTPRGRQALAVVWPQGAVQPAAPLGRKK